MAKTVAELLENIGNRLDDPAHRRFTPKELRIWLNEGMREIARRAECFPATTTKAVVAGTQDYTAPIDMVRIDHMQFEPTGDDQIFPVTFVERQVGWSVWGAHLGITQSSWPQYFTLWGTPRTVTAASTLIISLAPIPSQAGTLRIFYFRFPAAIDVNGAADTTAVDLPEGWEDLAVDYAETRAYRKDGNFDQYNLSRQEFMEKLVAIKETADGAYQTAARQIMPDWQGGGGWLGMDDYW